MGENIMNTLSGSYFVDKMVICLCFYLQTINIKWLFVHMLENKLISKVYRNVLPILGSLAMCNVYTSEFIYGTLKSRLGP